jgi:hypothetical protein
MPSSSRPCLVKMTRRSVMWQPEQMNVWCSQPRSRAVWSGTTLVRINSAPHAVQRNGRTPTSSPRSSAGCLPCLSKRRRRFDAGAGTPVAPPRQKNGPLLWLAVGTFAVGTERFMIAAILPYIAADLDVSVPAAGQLVTIFAITYALSAPTLAALTGRFDRRKLLTNARSRPRMTARGA